MIGELPYGIHDGDTYSFWRDPDPYFHHFALLVEQVYFLLSVDAVDQRVLSSIRPLKEKGDKYPVVYSFEIATVKAASRLVVWWLGIMKPWYVAVDTSKDGINYDNVFPWKMSLHPLFQPWLIFTDIFDFQPKQLLKKVKI